MTGHDDGNHTNGLIEVVTWDVSRTHFYGEARRWIYTYFLEGFEQKAKLVGLPEHVPIARCSVNLETHGHMS